MAFRVREHTLSLSAGPLFNSHALGRDEQANRDASSLLLHLVLAWPAYRRIDRLLAFNAQSTAEVISGRLLPEEQRSGIDRSMQRWPRDSHPDSQRLGSHSEGPGFDSRSTL